MADYLNIFTTVQARGPLQPGIDLGPGNSPRDGTPFYSYWLGKIRMRNLGPFIWAAWVLPR